MTHHEIPARHFSCKTLSKLTKKGIFLVGMTVIPDMTKDMPYACGQTGYEINDNGTGKLKTFLEVDRLANNA